MKAIAVFPGKPNSAHLAELAKPSVSDVPRGRGVLVKVLRVGVDGTDREINAAEYGAAPDGYDFLVIGHEGFGQVEAVGPNVTFIRPGDFVVATVRRPGSSLYDTIGLQDMTTDSEYFERGINLRHGYLTEYYVEDEAVRREGAVGPSRRRRAARADDRGAEGDHPGLRDPAPPEGLAPANSGRHGLWDARSAGLSRAATARPARDDVRPNEATVSQCRAARQDRRPLRDHDRTEHQGSAADAGAFDLIFEGTGSSAVVFESMQALAKNGVLVLTSITGGNRVLEVPADRINLDFVLGNKVMVGSVNASRENFETGVRDMSQAEAEYPGWMRRTADRSGARSAKLRGPVRSLAESERSHQNLL